MFIILYFPVCWYLKNYYKKVCANQPGPISRDNKDSCLPQNNEKRKCISTSSDGRETGRCTGCVCCLGISLLLEFTILSLTISTTLENNLPKSIVFSFNELALWFTDCKYTTNLYDNQTYCQNFLCLLLMWMILCLLVKQRLSLCPLPYQVSAGDGWRRTWGASSSRRTRRRKASAVSRCPREQHLRTSAMRRTSNGRTRERQ